MWPGAPRVVLTFLLARLSAGCTNFLITKGASADGATHFSYSNDGGQLYGELTFLEAADHAPGTMRDIWRWDDGRYLGSIPEVEHTYRVVGNMNEHQLAIGNKIARTVTWPHVLQHPAFKVRCSSQEKPPLPGLSRSPTHRSLRSWTTAL